VKSFVLKLQEYQKPKINIKCIVMDILTVKIIILTSFMPTSPLYSYGDKPSA